MARTRSGATARSSTSARALKSFQNILREYATMVYEVPWDSGGQKALRDRLQQAAPEVMRVVETVLGDGSVPIGGRYLPERAVSYTDLIALAVAGGSSDIEDIFRDLERQLNALINQCLGTLETRA